MSQTEEIRDDDNSLDLTPSMERASATEYVKYHNFMNKLTQFISKSENNEFLTHAKQILKFLQDRLSKSDGLMLESNEDAKEFTCKIRKVWKDPTFVKGVQATMKEVPSLIYDFVSSSNSANNGLPTDRIATMEADRCFKYFLEKLKFYAPTATTISLFLSLLIGHWTDEGLLIELDEQMGEKHFGNLLKMIADSKTRENVPLHRLSFNLESSHDVETLENLREVLINKHGEGHPCIETLVAELKRSLRFLLGLNQNHLNYDGGKTTITILDGGTTTITILGNERYHYNVVNFRRIRQ